MNEYMCNVEELLTVFGTKQINHQKNKLKFVLSSSWFHQSTAQ